MTETKKQIENLYPFLHGKAKNVASENAALLESVKQKSADSVREKEIFFQQNAQGLIDAAAAIAGVYKANGKMFTMGNGGSSCDASHFAVEFQHPVTAGRPALPAINLSVDAVLISALANDVGFDHVFARQLDALAQAHDGLIGFSTSGNSKNLIEAYKRAKDKGVTTFGFAGGDGGAMRDSGLVDHCLVVSADSVHRVQEVHVAAYHIIWDLVHTLLADHRGLTQ
jgi:D-sedoheptulose 7-phosphate isomerase